MAEEDLREVAADVAAATELLNTRLLDAQVRLAALGIGTTAAIKIDDDLELSFSKRGGTWKLNIQNTSETRDLLSGSKRERVLAAHALPALLAALRENAVTHLADLKSASDAVEAFLATLPEVPEVVAPEAVSAVQPTVQDEDPPGPESDKETRGGGVRCMPCGDAGRVMTARVRGGLPCPNCELGRTT